MVFFREFKNERDKVPFCGIPNLLISKLSYILLEGNNIPGAKSIGQTSGFSNFPML